MSKSSTYAERVDKDYAAVDELLLKASSVANEKPEMVEVKTEEGYCIIKVKTLPGKPVKERKEHRPGTCREPGRE